MNTTARKINSETMPSSTTVYARVWTFRTQELMDLFINEMQGQISDGQWENSRYTEWLWQGNDLFRLGNKTELHFCGAAINYYNYTKRVNYPLTKELIDAIDERIYTENGFEYGDKKSLKAAWNEITAAIKNWLPMTEDERNNFINIPYENIRNTKKNEKNEMMNILHKSNIIKWYSENSYKSWVDLNIDGTEITIWIDGRNDALKTLNLKLTTNNIELRVSKVSAVNLDENIMNIAKAVSMINH